jgi:hypothetical protein
VIGVTAGILWTNKDSRYHCPELLNRASFARVRWVPSCRLSLRRRITRPHRRIPMSSNQNSTTELPITGKLTMLFVCTLAILVLMIAASVAGVLHSHTFYPADDLRRMFFPNDVVNLCIGLPFLLVSLLLVWRNRLIGLLALFGALLFVLYNYLVYVFAMPLGIPFQLDLALVLLSTCALVILVLRIDALTVRQRLAGAVPERVAGSVLAGLGALFLLRAFGMLTRGITHQIPIPRTEFAVDIADLLITPFWIVGGVLLILRRAFGYVAAVGLFFQAGMLFIALAVFLPLRSLLTGSPFRLADAVVILVMSSVCFVPLILFVRKAGSRQRSQT